MINKNKSLPRWKYISADDETVGPYFLCLPPETRRRDVSCLCISDLLLRSLEFYLNIDNRRLVGPRRPQPTNWRSRICHPNDIQTKRNAKTFNSIKILINFLWNLNGNHRFKLIKILTQCGVSSGTDRREWWTKFSLGFVNSN